MKRERAPATQRRRMAYLLPPRVALNATPRHSVVTSRYPPLRVEPEPPDEPPRDPASEQRLLGALLIDNAAYHKVTGLLRAEHFAWTVHGRIYAAIGINAVRPNSDRGRFIATA
jgi:hypothetical protein